MLEESDKGIQEFFTYDGNDYCLVNLEFPTVGDLTEGTQKRIDSICNLER